MKIISYSDLHLEFGKDFDTPLDKQADLMILAGDIITLDDYTPLERMLENWNKPVLHVAGNHEFYNDIPINIAQERYAAWLKESHPNVHFLRDESFYLNGVNFFGGTMWTNFLNGNDQAMFLAGRRMNDYRIIKTSDNSYLTPLDTIEFHKNYVISLVTWLEQDLPGPRVIISHHAPINRSSERFRSENLLMDPAYSSPDMSRIIDQYQPDLWVYGHTHQPTDITFGKTRILSNPRGYPMSSDQYTCPEFDPNGCPHVV